MEEALPIQEEEKPRCPNCGKKMPRKGKFCPNCGQRRFDGRLRMAELYERFIRQAFHLDNKILKMSWHLLVPAKVSIAFFNGQIKRYPNPVQFFFVVMFFFVLLYSHTEDNKNQGPVKINASSGAQSQPEIKISGENFTQILDHYAKGKELRQHFDSLPDHLKTAEARKALDTLIVMSNPEFYALFNVIQSQSPDSLGNDLSKILDTLPISLLTQQVRVSVVDLTRLSPDDLADKYQITDWFSRIMLTQGMKAMKDPQGLQRNYLGSFTWTILLQIGAMSLILLWLFKKQRPYYAEHFVFLLHQHTGSFLLLTLALALYLLLPFPDPIWILIIFGIWVFLLFALQRFYRQSWGWAVVKWLVYSGIYAASFALIFTLSLIAVLILF